MSRQVTVILTKYNDIFGHLVGAVSLSRYSHASISIDENEEIYYSFNFKGFVRERPMKYKPKFRSDKYKIMRFMVSDESYEIIKSEIENFKNSKKKIHYARLGVLCCFLRIPVRFKNSYFCSQFIAELLQKADVATLCKKSSLYFPNDLANKLEINVPCLMSENRFSIAA